MAEQEEYLHIPGHVSAKEAATILELTEDQIWYYIRSKSLPARKVSGRYMIPLTAIKTFHPRPRGRTRVDPSLWHVYRNGAKVCELQIEIAVDPSQREDVQAKLQTVLDEQQHLFPGTMQRYVLMRDDQPETMLIQLIWKDTELTDEATLQHDLAAFQEEFAALLDWSTATYTRWQAVLHT